MEIKDLREAKRVLENNISTAVEGLIAEFQQSTKATVEAVSIDVIVPGEIGTEKVGFVSKSSVRLDI
ncbi:MAG: hypothetical protein MI862_27075 [Desulfobacterales bacterium]|nr:hypothetical protein [Desulfobacterales bacterium]